MKQSKKKYYRLSEFLNKFSINKFKSSMKPYIIIYKNIIFVLNYIKNYFENGFKNKTAFFYPDYPIKADMLNYFLSRKGYNITNNPRIKADILIAYRDATYVEYPDDLLEVISKKNKIINYKCTNIAKDHVDKIHVEVFGYGAEIDPLTYNGKCVKKSKINYAHDGVILDCPISEKDDQYIYQKLLSNYYNDKSNVEYRTSIVGHKIAQLFLSIKPLYNRFGAWDSADVNFKFFGVNYKDYLSAEEEDKIIRFCEKIGLDHGALDIIKNSDDNKIYILDANKTNAYLPANNKEERESEENLIFQNIIPLVEKEFSVEKISPSYLYMKNKII